MRNVQAKLRNFEIKRHPAPEAAPEPECYYDYVPEPAFEPVFLPEEPVDQVVTIPMVSENTTTVRMAGMLVLLMGMYSACLLVYIACMAISTLLL